MTLEYSFWKNKNILITGLTGFKGSWLALLLERIGAKVCGISLPAEKSSLFTICDLSKRFRSIELDIRDYQKLKLQMLDLQPEIVIHMAAQSLVKTSYLEPLKTFSTNVMGTVNILEAIREVDSVKAVVVVTTDKVYENIEQDSGYTEGDRLGGYDPYSSSKAACELVVNAYTKSYFQNRDIGIASARAGNVIGGGDFAPYRIVPDAMAAFNEGRPLELRYPQAVRPWQHVLDPVNGYLVLAEKLFKAPKDFSNAYNFGPDDELTTTVEKLVGYLVKGWGSNAEVTIRPVGHEHEAGLLKLDCSKAKRELGWQPLLNWESTMKLTLDWYKSYFNFPSQSLPMTEQQVEFFLGQRKSYGMP